jgi:hypothetical protein
MCIPKSGTKNLFQTSSLPLSGLLTSLSSWAIILEFVSEDGHNSFYPNTSSNLVYIVACHLKSRII